MSIEIGSKFVKDGEVVEVKALTSSILVEVVWYSKNDEKEHVLTKDDFLEQYKPCEVVYEYQYAYLDGDGSAETTIYFYKDDAELLSATLIKVYQRLDFTKRERKPQPTSV